VDFTGFVNKSNRRCTFRALEVKRGELSCHWWLETSSSRGGVKGDRFVFGEGAAICWIERLL
jgi:hypothetical protein